MSAKKRNPARMLVPTGARGFHWQWQAGIQPAVIAAADKVMPPHPRPLRSQHAYWALDVDYAPGYRYRVHSYRSRWQPRQPQTAHLYAPDTLYWEDLSRIETPRLRSRAILFQADVLPSCAWIKASSDYAVIHDPGEELGALIDRLIDLGHDFGPRAGAQAQAVLWEIIGRLQSVRQVEARHFELEGSAQRPLAGQEESPFVKAVHDFLHERLTHPITLADLARHLDLSVSTISHRYRRETGSTPMNRLIQMRLDLARGMLIRGDRLQQIAEQTGFSDAFHLSKTFTRHFNLSPRQFRQLHTSRPAQKPQVNPAGDAQHGAARR